MRAGRSPRFMHLRLLLLSRIIKKHPDIGSAYATKSQTQHSFAWYAELTGGITAETWRSGSRFLVVENLHDQACGKKFRPRSLITGSPLLIPISTVILPETVHATRNISRRPPESGCTYERACSRKEVFGVVWMIMSKLVCHHPLGKRETP